MSELPGPADLPRDADGYIDLDEVESTPAGDADLVSLLGGGVSEEDLAPPALDDDTWELIVQTAPHVTTETLDASSGPIDLAPDPLVPGSAAAAGTDVEVDPEGPGAGELPPVDAEVADDLGADPASDADGADEPWSFGDEV